MGQNTLQKFVFLLGLSLDHVLSVMRIKEKLSRLGVRYEFHEIIITYTKYDEIINNRAS